ncbi:hypothetical protein JHK85_028090 [Glycine max]|nr:hypothetical protein JHK85_028090 [Glycine max]
MYERYTPLTANCTTILEEAFNAEELDLEDIKRIDIGITTQTKEGIEQKIEEDRDTTNKDVIDNLRKNEKMSLPSKSESSQSRKHHLHAIRDIDINYVNTPSPQSLPSITFTDRDFKGINPINQDDPIIANFMVSKVFID